MFSILGEDAALWAALSPNSFLGDISGPLQLHPTVLDHEVPYEYSVALEKDLKTAGKTVELYRYEGDDHNIFRDCSVAKPRSIASLDEYQKR